MLQDSNRDTHNQNLITKREIHQKREAIEQTLTDTEQVYRETSLKQVENNALVDEIEALSRHIVILEDQNEQLDKETEKFMLCDQEIRAKLQDRSRSPLKLSDLYHGNDKAKSQPQHEHTQSDPLINLEKVNSHQQTKREEPRQKSPKKVQFYQQSYYNDSVNDQFRRSYNN